MNAIVKLTIFLLTIFIPASPLPAEIVTFQQAVNIALRDNPRLLSYFWTVRAQHQDVESEKGRLYPTLRFEEQYRRTNNPTYSFMAKLNQERFEQSDFQIDSLNSPHDISDFQSAISFEQPLFVPGTYDGIVMAGRELEAKEAEYVRKQEEVIREVIKAFNMVRTAQEFVVAARKGMEDATEHKRLASMRYEAGAGLYSDVLRAEVALREAESILIKAESGLEVSRRSLGLVLGRTEPVDVAGDKPRFVVNDVDWYLNASRQRGDLNALRLRTRSAKKALAMEKSSFLPSVGVGGSYLLNDHNDPFSPEGESYIFMGFLRWNLFDASLYNKIGKAKMKVREVEEKLSGLEKEIHFRIHEAYIKVNEKEQNLLLAQSVLAEAEEALRLVRSRYENALAPLVDLLDTQSMVTSSRAALLEAENEHLNAIADLYYQSGVLLEKVEQYREIK